jgi:hypothetical protein
MTIALTVSSTAPGNVLKDEVGKILTVANGGGPGYENAYSVVTMNAAGVETKRVDTMEYISKVITTKYGNVELLKELVAIELLPKKGASPFIAGWSLVVVSDESEQESLFARHTDKTMVPLEGFGVGFDSGLGEASTSNIKEVITTTTNPSTSDSTTTRTLTDTFASKGEGNGQLIDLLFTGLYTETGSKVVIKSELIAGEKILTDVWVVGALKLDKIIGSTPPESDSENGGVVEGTMSTTASVLTDLNLYMPAF